MCATSWSRVSSIDWVHVLFFFFFQAEDGIRDYKVTGVQTCALPIYPARLEVVYPESLSRGLVLVKWWLLALPHYLVVAVFTGSAWSAASGNNWMWTSGGLIGLLVCFAGVVLLFTGRYPRSLYDFVMG